jgi:phosphate starvation-inducible protein PhoH
MYSDGGFMIFIKEQNCNYDEIRTVYTRLGENCKFIMCGDTKQDDLTKSKNRNDVSGLFKFLKVLEKVKDFSVINFCRDDIIRSQQVKNFIIAEELYLENA